MSRNAIIGIVVVLVILVGGFWLFQSQMGSPTQTQPTVETPAVESSPSAEMESTDGAEQEAANSVTISSDGFNPQTITIAAGEEVTWLNDDSEVHTVNSDPHPTHTANPFLNNVGRLQPGDSKSLEFPTAGSYKYHDHLNPSLTGTIVVQ